MTRSIQGLRHFFFLRDLISAKDLFRIFAVRKRDERLTHDLSRHGSSFLPFDFLVEVLYNTTIKGEYNV